MSVLGGFDDLRAKDIAGFEPATGIVYFANGEKVERRQMTITPSGSLSTRAIEPTPVDQTESEGLPKRVPVSQRWAGTDQMRDGRAVQ